MRSLAQTPTAIHRPRRRVRGLMALALVACLGLTPGAAAAQRVHVVAKGHTLSAIAGRYGVSVEDICQANGISPKVMLKPGQKLIIPSKTAPSRAEKNRPQQERPKRAEQKRPEKKGDDRAETAPKTRVTDADRAAVRWHKVAKGQHLGSIARRYAVSIEALCLANGIRKEDPIQPGHVLVIPASSDEDGAIARAVLAEKSTSVDATDAKAKRDDEPSWKKYAKKPEKPGYVVLVRADGTSWKGHVRGKGGSVLSGAKKAFREMLATNGGAEKDIDPRLIALVGQVSDTFGGRAVRIVSGYRDTRAGPGSRHRHGRALDFTIDGVPVTALRDYLKTLDAVGIGYYPNSHFVHLDVREHWTYWIDYAGPGQPARYGGFWTKKGRVR
jgi:LysM repeat protein